MLKYPTEEMLERICDAHWNGGKGEGVTFRDIYQHNACNHTLSVTIEENGTVYGFVIDNGDWNGTVVVSWGLEDDVASYKHPEPGEQLTFVQINPCLRTERPEMWQVYLWWRDQSWFKEKNRNYLYDRHFQPGVQIEKHYREWAAQKRMTIGLLSNCDGSLLI